MLYYNILYCTSVYYTVLYCTVVLYYSVLYCTGFCCIVLYCSVLYCAALHNTVLYYFCTVLCCTMLCCTVACCVVLYGNVEFMALTCFMPESLLTLSHHGNAWAVILMVAITDTGHWFGTERQRYSAASVIKATSAAPTESQNVCTLHSFLLSLLVFVFVLLLLLLFFLLSSTLLSGITSFPIRGLNVFVLWNASFIASFYCFSCTAIIYLEKKNPAFRLFREICCCFIVFTCRFLSTTTFPLPN